jgi:YD repeat-containing protein
VTEFPYGENQLTGYNQLLIFDEENERYRYLDAAGMAHNYVLDSESETDDIYYPEGVENLSDADSFVALVTSELLAEIETDLPIAAVLMTLNTGRFLCFDAAGRLLAVAAQETTEDENGDPQTVFSVLLSVTYVGDSLVQIETVTLEDGTVLTFIYDEDGFFLGLDADEPDEGDTEETTEPTTEDTTEPTTTESATEDPEETTTEPETTEPEDELAEKQEINELNAWGQPVTKGSSVSGLTLVQTFAYTVNGNYATMIADENGTATNYVYNPDNGQKESEHLGDTTPVNYTYDASGALVAVTQAVAGLTNGTALANQYARENDRLVSIARNGVLYEFTYDAFGNALASKVNGEIYWENSYANAAKGEVGQLIYANGLTLTYTYENGKVATISYDDGETLAFEYEYDDAGKLVTLTDNINDRVTTYGHAEYGESYFEIADKDGNVYYRRGATGDNSVTEEFFGLVFTLSKESSTDAATGNTTTNSTAELGGESRTFSRVEDVFGRSIQKQARGSDGDVVLNSDYKLPRHFGHAHDQSDR